MPLVKKPFNGALTQAWASFCHQGERLRAGDDGSRSLLDDRERSLLLLPSTQLEWSPLFREMLAANNGAERALLDPAALNERRKRLSQLTDLLLRAPALERLWVERLPLEPSHTILRAPYAELASLVLEPTASASPHDTGSGTQAAPGFLFCETKGQAATPAPDVLAELADGQHQKVAQRVCRAATLYTALYSTLMGLATLDQMRLPLVSAYVGRSAVSNDHTVHLACWFHVGEDVRVYLGPRFVNIGDVVSVSCAHAILFMQPWMTRHPRADHSWWISLAQHSHTHFNRRRGLYSDLAGDIDLHRGAHGKGVPMYYGASPFSSALRGMLGKRIGSALGAGRTGFYPAGRPENRVAFSDTHTSLVSFVAGEWPFEAGSIAAVIVNTFVNVIRKEVAGLRSRLQTDPRSFL